MRELWKDESGVTTVEYALLLAVVALAALAGYQLLGENVNATATAAADEVPGTITTGS
ncbi:MAG: Flp family type IVb pilin [Armatimonadota bacterium]